MLTKTDSDGSCQVVGIGLRQRKSAVQEMVSLVSATQNEVAKGAMDAWATILQAGCSTAQRTIKCCTKGI